MNSKYRTAMYWSSRKTIRGHLALARISNSPTVASDTIAGASLAGVLLQFDARIGLLALATITFYTAGMYLNDLLDYAIDCEVRPDRPLPSGIVSRPAALSMTVALFCIGSVILFYVGLVPFLTGLFLIGVIVLYDKWHKRNALSPLLMASCRLLVYVMSFFAFSSQSVSALIIPGSLLFGYVSAITYFAKIEAKQDIKGKTGLAAILFLPIPYFATTMSVYSTPLIVLFGMWVAYNIFLAHRPLKSESGYLVSNLIAGISLLDCLVLAKAGSSIGWVALSLGAFVLTLFLQRYVRGT